MNSPTDPSQAHPNSSPTHEERVRQRTTRRRHRLFFWVPVLTLLGATATYGGWLYLQRTQAPFNGPTWTVTRERLRVTIVERGTLESAENSDVVCRVKAGKKGTSGIIKWVIEDGAQVDKGQKLVEIEDSALQEDFTDQINKVNKARSDWISAKETLQITESQNFSDIESAKTTQILAELELKKFLGDTIAAKVLPVGTRAELQRYLLTHLNAELSRQLAEQSRDIISDVVQTLSDIEGRVELAKSDHKLFKERADWSMRMLIRGYLSRSQAEADKSKLDSAELALKKTQVEHDLFRKYTIEQKVTELWSKVKEAERALDRVKSQAQSKYNTAVADLDSKKAMFAQELDRKLDIEEEIQRCTLYAPQAGLVVYHVSEQSRYGSGSQQSIVAQGEPVKEGQKLMRIPNLARMMVNTRVHEATVSKVKGEITRTTGFGELLRGALAFNPWPMTVTVNQAAFLELRSEIREVYRKEELQTLYAGQRAGIRVDAYPSKVFEGRVKSVATVASQSDWMSSDVKVYQTMVSIDDTVINLKPGMSAEVTIFAEESTEPVLTIPIQSVAGSITMGAKRKCFVLIDGQPRERDIVVGRSNDKSVEVKEGLEEGEKVVLNPRSLLGDKSGMKTGTPATRRGVDADEMSGGGGGAKKGKKGGGKGNPMGGGLPPDMGPGGFNPGGPPGAGGKQFNRPDADVTNKKS